MAAPSRSAVSSRSARFLWHTLLAATKGGTGFASYAAGDLSSETGSGLGSSAPALRRLPSSTQAAVSRGRKLRDGNHGPVASALAVGEHLPIASWRPPQTEPPRQHGRPETVNFAATRPMDSRSVLAPLVLLNGTTTVTGVGTPVHDGPAAGDSLQVGIDMRKVVPSTATCS